MNVVETAAGLVKLKPNSSTAVSDWKNTLENRRDEAIATLRDEGVQIESWFEVHISGDDYLLWFMRAESIEKVWAIAANSKHEIDSYHFQVMADITAPDGEIAATPILDICNNNVSD